MTKEELLARAADLATEWRLCDPEAKGANGAFKRDELQAMLDDVEYEIAKADQWGCVVDDDIGDYADENADEHYWGNQQ